MPDERELITSTPIQEEQESTTPSAYLSVNISQEAQTELEKFLDGHLETIKNEMGSHLSRFQEEDNQLEGKMPGADYPYPGAFRINYPLTKKKTREIANRIKQAYLDSDPIWAITLSGEESTEIEQAIADKIERVMDNSVDNHLEALDDIAQAIFNSVQHGIGAIVPSWQYKEAIRKEVETWRGFDGTTQDSMDEVLRFEKRYPDFRENKELSSLHTQLLQGKTITREFTYRTAVKNSPSLMSIDPRKLRVYPGVEGYQGLRDTPCYGYVETYRYHELVDLADSGQIDEASLQRLYEVPSGRQENPDYQNEEFEVFIGTINYDLEGERAPYKVMFELSKKVLLRVRGFSWWYGEPDLIPFYIRQEEAGFFKRGVAWDVKDDHIALIVLLNLYLNGVDMANSLRLKVKKGSPAEGQLLSRRWSPHIGLAWKDNPNEIETMVHQLTHLGSIVDGMEIMRRNSDENTQTSSLQSGLESPRDPRAPAAKTAILLREVAPNEKEYIRSMEPAFRTTGRYILWMYYQGLRLEWIDEIPGSPSVTADQIRPILDRLNPRALLFETDRNQENEKDLAVLNIMSQVTQDPAIMARIYKEVISGVSSKWAKIISQVPLEQILAQPQPQPGIPQGTPSPPGGGLPQPSVVPTPGGNGA